MHEDLDFIERNIDEAYFAMPEYAARNQTARLIERESDCDSGTVREVKRTHASPLNKKQAAEHFSKM